MPQGSLLPQIKESDLKEKGLFRVNSIFQLLASRVARLGDLLVGADGIASSRGFRATGQDTIPEDPETLITLATARKLFHPQVVRGALVQGLWVPTGEKVQPLSLGGARGGSGGGGAIADFAEIVFNIAINKDATVGSDVTPHRILTANEPLMRMVEVAGVTKRPAVGQDLKLEIIRTPGGSIFSTPMVFPAGSSSIVTVTTFANNPQVLAYHDRYTVNVLQVGTTDPGGDISLFCKYRWG